MVYDPGALNATLSAAVGSDPELVAELHAAFIESAERQADLMGRARCDANWLVAAARLAVLQQAPLIAIPASGGARMQEGILSLMQMPRSTVAVEMVREAGLPYIVLLTDPTTGGVSASFAMLGDIQIAEPGAVIGFACATSSSMRVGLGATCASDRDCTFGLVCIGDSKQRHCQYERYESCKTSMDCLPGRVCRDGYCIVECLADSDCGASPDGGKDEVRCVVGECKSESGERKCAYASDCLPGQDCISSRCVDRAQLRCMSDFDCKGNERCIGNQCK